MKITQKEKEFNPITFTIESEDELNQFLTIANNNNMGRAFPVIMELFDYFYEKKYYPYDGIVSHKYFEKLNEILR